MARSQSRYAFLVHIALLVAAGVTRAEEAAPTASADSLPGSEVPPGPGLSPQAPPVPPAPGGRAPSFGAPAEKSSATFHLGGRLFGYEAVGVGSKPSNPPPGYSGTPLHVPALAPGKLPFWGGSGATLNLDYGTPSLRAYVTYYFRPNGQEYQGFSSPQQGPGFGVAYLMVTPDPIGRLHLQFKVGSFVEVYGGPGQWGWGVFGPLLALKGYGETTTADWDLTRDVRMTLVHGLLINPGVPEDFARGDYNPWIETGTSGFVHHAHLAAAYKQYTFRLHYASAYGTDDRKYLLTFDGLPPRDGRMDTYLAEAHWQEAPWGQLGVTGGVYNFDKAEAVGNGVWWAVDWTQGAREMINKYLGGNSNGTGKVAVIGAEYNFSVSSILWYPRSFNGNAPDIRVAIAAMLTRTVATDDPLYKNAMGYFFGMDTEYRMTSKLSLMFSAYGEDRVANMYVPHRAPASAPGVYPDPTMVTDYVPLDQRWRVYSLNPGIAFHTNWNSLDRLQLFYSRRFYSGAVDSNSAQPLDHHMITLGGYVTF
jgi:hypothetical protein